MTALLLIACERNNSSDVPQPNLALIQEIKSLPQPAVRLAFAKLTPAEKNILWQDHFEEVLNNPQFSPALKAHTLKLKAIVNEAHFKRAGTAEFEAYMEEFTKHWYTEPIARGEFADADLLYIGTLYGIGRQSTAKGNPGASATNGVPIDDEEADGGAKCSCRYSISCPGSTSCEDSKKSCERVGGCGITGTSNCTGNCG